MKRITFLSLVFLALATMDVLYAHNEVDVYVGTVCINSHEAGTSPRKKIIITTDSISHTREKPEGRSMPVNALYSICDSDGDYVVTEERVSRNGSLSIEDLSVAGTYQLQIFALEDCVLNLITDFRDSQPVMESVPLSSAGVYHLEIVVTDDNE